MQQQVVHLHAGPVATECRLHMQQPCTSKCTQAADHRVDFFNVTLCVLCQVKTWWWHETVTSAHSKALLTCKDAWLSALH